MSILQWVSFLSISDDGNILKKCVIIIKRFPNTKYWAIVIITKLFLLVDSNEVFLPACHQSEKKKLKQNKEIKFVLITYKSITCLKLYIIST